MRRGLESREEAVAGGELSAGGERKGESKKGEGGEGNNARLAVIFRLALPAVNLQRLLGR